MAFELPDAGEAAYVLDLLFDVGPAKAGDMGARSLEWSDIEPWLRITGYQLSMWEMRVLLRLSVAYCETLYAARNPAMSAPGSAQESPEQQQERRDRVAKQMAESLRMLARSRPQRK